MHRCMSGMRVQQRVIQGCTALDYAVKHQHKDCAIALMREGAWLEATEVQVCARQSSGCTSWLRANNAWMLSSVACCLTLSQSQYMHGVQDLQHLLGPLAIQTNVSEASGHDMISDILLHC